MPDTTCCSLFGSAVIESGTGWELSLGTGRCIGDNEPWIVKSTVGTPSAVAGADQPTVHTPVCVNKSS